MSLVERKARITELLEVLKDATQASDLGRNARIYGLMIDNAKAALKVTAKDVSAKGWFVVQLYKAKIGLHTVLIEEEKDKVAGAIEKKIKAMTPMVEALMEYGQGIVEFRIRTWLELAYQRIRKGGLEKAFDPLNEVLQLAKRKGLKAIEVATLEAMGDVMLMNGSSKVADSLYDKAMASAATDEARQGVVLRRNEALMGGDTGVVKEIWEEMSPALWLLRKGLAEFDGGVADESLKDAVPPPEIAAAEGAVGRARALETRREFLDAFRAAKRAREAIERAKER